jgi:hypothetical protein
VRAELERVEADASDPLASEAGILTCREAIAVVATTGADGEVSQERFKKTGNPIATLGRKCTLPYSALGTLGGSPKLVI